MRLLLLLKEYIDIIIPFDKDLSFFDTSYLKNCGVGKILIQRRDGTFEENQIAKHGKTVRLLSLFPLSQNDFFSLLISSDPLVGCTGDGSFSDVISAQGKIPFYEVLPHKEDFFHGYMRLTHTSPHYKRYLSFMGGISCFDMTGFNNLKGEIFRRRLSGITRIGKAIGELLRSSKEEILKEAQKVHSHIKESHNFNEVPSQVLTHFFGKKEYPELAKVEKTLEEKYLKGQITIEEAYLQMQRKIHKVTQRVFSDK